MKPSLLRSRNRVSFVAMPGAVHGVQLEWEFMLTPAPRARFLEFPLAGEWLRPAARRSERKRRLAA